MVNIATRVIHDNNMQDKITIIPKRSTEMTSHDLPMPVDIIVMEIFDTELIGEGVLDTMHHALKVKLWFLSF